LGVWAAFGGLGIGSWDWVLLLAAWGLDHGLGAAQLTIVTARLFGAGIYEWETTAGCLARDRLAARERVPRNKISGKKKDDGPDILHNGWRSPDFRLAIFFWGFAICLKCITSNT